MNFLIIGQIVGVPRCLIVAAWAGLCLLRTTSAHGQDWHHAYDLSGNFVVRAAAANSAPPQILGQPQLQLVSPGELASFSVVLADARDLAYQWRFKGADIAGATSDTFLLSNLGATNEGPYSVVVANSSGSVTSAPALLMLDSDGDGLPDSWEQTYFGNLTSQRSLGDADGDGSSNVNEFFDGTNPTNSAAFRPRLTVGKIGSGSGEVTVVPAKPSYDPGEQVTLSATPLAPSLFVGWSGSLNTTTNPISLTMSSNQTVQAKFVTAVAPPSSMIALWRAETDASDSVGANHGVFYRGTDVVGPSVTSAGKVGSAFSFDGTVHVRIPDSATLRPAQMTAEAWVYPTSQNSDYQTVFARGSGFPLSSADTWFLAISQGIPYFHSHGGNVIQAPFMIPPNQWNHLAISFDGSTKRLYVNGVEAAAQGGLGAWAYDASAPVTIGSDWDFGASSLRFNGQIDEVALYDRALTASEIAAIHDADAAGRILNRLYFTSRAEFPQAYIGVDYAQQVTVILGTAPVSFALAAGALPPGVTLSSPGVLAGNPMVSGNFYFTVRATDGAAVSIEQDCILTVVGRVIPPAGMVAWWRAENDALDSAGANHGTLSNGVTFVAGHVNQAFAFDGVNQSIAIPDAPALRTASLTLEAWVRLNTTDGVQVIFSKPAGFGSESYFLYLGDGTLRGRVGDSAGPGNALTGPLLTTGRWYHVAYTFDGDFMEQVLYVDGVEMASGTGIKPIGYDTQPLLLGRDSESGSAIFFLDGNLDEAAIYNRVLSGAEIASIYQAGPAGKSTAGPYINAPSQLPDAFAGEAYGYTFTSPRGTAPVDYALMSAPPPGLTLSSAGLLGGTPTTSGLFNFTARVTDAAALSAEQTFALRVFERVPAPAGLVAWWPGESNALDMAGTNHGMLTNGVTFVPGKVGQAFSLNGLGQAVVIPDAPALRLASLTFEAWVSFDSPSGFQFIVAKPLGAGADESYALWSSGNSLGSLAGGADQGHTLFAPFTPVLGRWYHIAYIFDDPFDVQAIYIDGVLAASAAATQSIAYDAQPLLLGGDLENSLPNYFLEGRIDEAAIYSRALSGAEIASIHSAGPLGKRIRPILPPLLLGASRQGAFISISFDADPGRSYAVEYTDVLDRNVWSALTNITATGTNVVFYDSLTNAQQRFYRVFRPGN